MNSPVPPLDYEQSLIFLMDSEGNEPRGRERKLPPRWGGGGGEIRHAVSLREETLHSLGWITHSTIP